MNRYFLVFYTYNSENKQFIGSGCNAMFTENGRFLVLRLTMDMIASSTSAELSKQYPLVFDDSPISVAITNILEITATDYETWLEKKIDE